MTQRLCEGNGCATLVALLVSSTQTFYPNAPSDVNWGTAPLRSLYVYDNVDTAFIYNDNFGRFTPLYVFNVQEGDTICIPVIPDVWGYSTLRYHPVSGDTSFCLVVDSIRSRIYDTTTLRTFYSHFLSDEGRMYTDNVAIYNWSRYHSSDAIKGIYAERIGGIGASLLPIRIQSWVEKPSGPTGDVQFQTWQLGFRCYSDSVNRINISNGDCNLVPGVLDIEEMIEKMHISIYPNPSSGSFTIQLEQPMLPKPTITITDLSGRNIQAQMIPVGNSKMEIKLDHAPAGIYILQLDIDGNRFYKKLVLKPQ